MQELPGGEAREGQGACLRTHTVAHEAIAIGTQRASRQRC